MQEHPKDAIKIQNYFRSIANTECNDINITSKKLLFLNILNLNVLMTANEKQDIDQIITQKLLQRDNDPGEGCGGGGYGGGDRNLCEACECECAEGEGGGEDDSCDNDDEECERKPCREVRRRIIKRDTRETVKKHDKSETVIYVETQYYKETETTLSLHFCEFHNFYLEYIDYIIAKDYSKPFISKSFVDREYTFLDVIGLLSFSGLQLKSEEHGYRTISGLKAEIKAASNMALLRNEIKSSVFQPNKDILVAVNYTPFVESQEKSTEYVNEYLINEPYTCNVIITNISSKSIEIAALIQIPEGAIPIINTANQKTNTLNIDEHSTKKMQYTFYFPAPGKYHHTSAILSSNEKVVWVPQNTVIEVKSKMTQLNTESFKEVAEKGTDEEIIHFIETKNLLLKNLSFDLNKIFWKFENKAFYDKVIPVLRDLGIYSYDAWSYSILHGDITGIRELFENTNLMSKIGTHYASKLFEFKRHSMYLLRHLDFFPLINGRTHGEQIMNQKFKHMYSQFLSYCVQKSTLDYMDWLEMCIYLLLQDRMHEAFSIFKRIDEKVFINNNTAKLQYDYMKAYFDFSYGYPNFKISREIVDKYVRHPLLGWRILFKDMKLKLQEFDGTKIDRDEEMEGKLKKTKEFLNCSIEKQAVSISYNGLSFALIKIYPIDIEFFFSRSPFLNENKEMLTYIEPCKVLNVKLDPSKEVMMFDIPLEYRNSNIVIEVNSTTGLSHILFYTPNKMCYKINEEFGEIKITDFSKKPLPGVYVKAIALTHSNTTEFYKDGYTDINGEFDYLSLSTNQATTVSKLALLILSPTEGSIVTECKPSADIASAKVSEEQERQQQQWGKGVSQKMMKKAKKFKYEEEE